VPSLVADSRVTGDPSSDAEPAEPLREAAEALV
jgi:hypothetical protein